MSKVPQVHRNLLDAVESLLQQIFHEGKYADRAIESLLKQNRKWGSRDRRFIAETTYDCVRWWRKILYCGELDDSDPEVFAQAIQSLLILQDKALPDSQDYGVNADQVRMRESESKSNRAINESVPDWLDALGEQELGDEWAAELHALNEPAQVILRVNTIRCTPAELRQLLSDSEIETNVLTAAPDALLLRRRMNVFSLPAFKEGKFEIQDASSQAVAPFLDVKEGMRIIDACAGAGGKTLHLAALMNNTGQIIATDTEQRKLDELKKRGRRAGVTNVETRFISCSKVIKRLKESFDRVLLDVPCSGLGVLRRNPDAKWKLVPESMEKVKTLQTEILDRYSQMVKPGGKLVYATCSILPSENQEQVQKFLSRHVSFTLEEEKRILPSEGFDGFYMARLIRGK